jgi:hypothetical protein
MPCSPAGANSENLKNSCRVLPPFTHYYSEPMFLSNLDVPTMIEREIFAEALERKESAERAAFLNKACGDDLAMRNNIEGLLCEHERLGSFIEAPASELAQVTLPLERTVNSSTITTVSLEAGVLGDYTDPITGDVPVCFLSTDDVTGGNSGSPILNGSGELIGLVFDGNYEAISADYQHIAGLTRTINVDSRYMLFILDKLANAQNVLDELKIVDGRSGGAGSR